MQTDCSIQTKKKKKKKKKKEDLILNNKKKRTYLVDFAVSPDHTVKGKVK